VNVKEISQQLAFPEQWVADDAAGKEAEFAELVNRHSRFVFQVAYAILRNAHDCEDAVQETFLRVYRAQSWREWENERAFLARVAWRVAVDRLPRRRHEGVRSEMAANGANPEESAIAADRHAEVHRLIDALPEELRQPLALSTVQELNSREIAGIMGIAEGTVRTRLMRAREILKQKLAAKGARHDRR
jgi:RNA polymerase sigma-70 factor (ECF subfamily)